MIAASLLTAAAVLSWWFVFHSPLELIRSIGRSRVERENRTQFYERAADLGIYVDADLVMGLRTIVAAALAVISGLVLVKARLPGLLLSAGALLAWQLPERWLASVEKERHEDLIREFPTMVTLLRVYAKAGDLYRALNVVRGALRGELRRQMDIMAAEMEVYPLQQALENLARRCKYAPLSNFVGVVLLGIKSGADIDKILASFAAQSYEQRVNEIKRRIRMQPVIMSVVPAMLAMCFLLVLVFPMYANIIERLQGL